MTQARQTIVIFMTLAILCGLCGMVFATTNAILDDTATPPMVNPFEYATAPDGLNDTPIDPESFLDGE